MDIGQILFLFVFFKDKVDVHKNASRISLFKQACSIKYLALLIIMNQEGLVYFKTLQRKPTVFVALIINPQESLIYVFSKCFDCLLLVDLLVTPSLKWSKNYALCKCTPCTGLKQAF